MTVATESTKWNELIAFQRESERLLNATLSLDEKAVAAGMRDLFRRDEYLPGVAPL